VAVTELAAGGVQRDIEKRPRPLVKVALAGRDSFRVRAGEMHSAGGSRPPHWPKQVHGSQP